MTSEKDEEAFDFFSRLLRQLQQTEQNQRGCNINLVYVASGAQHVDSIQHQHNYYGEQKENGQEESTEEDSPYPAMGLLCQLVKEAVEAGKQAKYILMPQRAAMEAKVMLPPIDAEWYNKRFGTNLNKVNLSNWLKGTGGASYAPDELEPLKERFKMLK